MSLFPEQEQAIHICERCRDLGLWLTPMGIVTVCPKIQLGHAHAEMNDAARMIERAGRSLLFRRIVPHQLAFDVAATLSQHTTAEPAGRNFLLNRHFVGASSQRIRKLHYVIAELRDIWLLPVASRKDPPYGYWISIGQQDFEEWVTRAASAPRTQLSTIFRVARANWPLYAEQLEMEFWKDLSVASASADDKS